MSSPEPANVAAAQSPERELNCRILVLVSLFAAAVAFAGQPIANPLGPCPDKPNCVSTAEPNASHGVTPLPFHGTAKQTHDELVRLIGAMPGSAIVRTEDSYIHAMFTSRLFGFVDDVEFYLDEQEHVVHMRSASRSGYYDFGVNKRRLDEVAEEWAKGRRTP